MSDNDTTSGDSIKPSYEDGVWECPICGYEDGNPIAVEAHIGSEHEDVLYGTTSDTDPDRIEITLSDITLPDDPHERQAGLRDLEAALASAVEATHYPEATIEISPVQGHATLEDCTAAEAYLPSAEHDTVVGEEAFAEVATQTVECPVCGRQYDYVFDHEGVYDTDAQRWVDDPPERFTEGEHYVDGTTYNIPIESDDGRDLEIVYVLDHLAHDGDILHTY